MSGYLVYSLFSFSYFCLKIILFNIRDLVEKSKANGALGAGRGRGRAGEAQFQRADVLSFSVPLPLPRYILGGGRPFLLPPLNDQPNAGTGRGTGTGTLTGTGVGNGNGNGINANEGVERYRDQHPLAAFAENILPGLFSANSCSAHVLFKCPMCRSDIDSTTGLLESTLDLDERDRDSRGVGGRGSVSRDNNNNSYSNRNIRRSNVSWFNDLFRGGGFSHSNPPSPPQTNRPPPSAIRLVTRSSQYPSPHTGINRSATSTTSLSLSLSMNADTHSTLGSGSIAASIYTVTGPHTISSEEGESHRVRESGRGRQEIESLSFSNINSNIHSNIHSNGSMFSNNNISSNRSSRSNDQIDPSGVAYPMFRLGVPPLSDLLNSPPIQLNHSSSHSHSSHSQSHSNHNNQERSAARSTLSSTSSNTSSSLPASLLHSSSSSSSSSPVSSAGTSSSINRGSLRSLRFRWPFSSSISSTSGRE